MAVTVTVCGSGPRVRQQLDMLTAGTRGVQLLDSWREGATLCRLLVIDRDSAADALTLLRGVLGWSIDNYSIQFAADSEPEPDGHDPTMEDQR